MQAAVLLGIAWSAATLRGKLGALAAIETTAWVYLILSGITMGAFYLLFFAALAEGPQSRVVPLERLSLVLAMILGGIFFHEKLGWQVIVGGALMAAGALFIGIAKE